jgi:protein deglycase
MKFACLLSDGFEDLEAIGTVDILKRAGIEIDLVSVLNEQTVTGSYGIKIIPNKMMNQISVNDYDGILIPGGKQAYYIRELDSVLKLVKQFYRNDKWLMSICAGPTVFGVLGILDGKKYISFPGTEISMNNAIRVDEPVVKDGKFITARAAGSVFDFAFEIIKTVLGEEVLNNVKERIVYNK